MLYPLTFHPIFKERIWGGTSLETLYHKSVPAGPRIGESWEISDRPGDESVIANGPLKGRTLGSVLREDPAALLGPTGAPPARFPLLIKIIDAKDDLSLQVHPPAHVAVQLGGDPKTEMWYITQAGPGAEIFAGLKRGVTRAEFERKLAVQTVADCFNRLTVRQGDAMFLPSGRVHALGANILIFEVQQNSDTTYRVFDWNRVDAQGKPRDLHVPQSLASIDFHDFEPKLLPHDSHSDGAGEVRPLVNNNLFEVTVRTLPAGAQWPLPPGRITIIGVAEGRVRVVSSSEPVELVPGGFCLVPAVCASATTVHAATAATFLEIAC